MAAASPSRAAVWICDVCGVVSEPLPVSAADQAAGEHDHDEHGGEPTAYPVEAESSGREVAPVECPDPGHGANRAGVGSPSTTCKDSERRTSMLRLTEPPGPALTPVHHAEVEAPPAAELVTLPPRTVELVSAPSAPTLSRRGGRPDEQSGLAVVAALVGGMVVSGAAGLMLADLLWPMALSAAGVPAAVVACLTVLGAMTGARCPGVHCGGCGR
jgi:hypothetical protein